MLNKKSEYIIHKSIIVFIILMVLPFFVLCFFNHPCPEDLSFTEYTHRIGFLNTQIYMYNDIGGRFLTCALLSINPLIFHSIPAFKLLIFLFMIFFFFVLHFFINQLFSGVLLLREKLIISLSILFLYLYGMPSVSEGFYYLAGITTYNVSIILLFLAIVFYKWHIEAKTKKSKMFFGACTMIWISAIMGTTELMIALIFLSILIFITLKIYFEKKLSPVLVFFILFLAAVFYFIILSPGSDKRQNYSDSIFDIIYSSLIFTFESMYFWVINTPLIGFTIMLIPVLFILTGSKKSVLKIFTINPVISFIISFIYLLTMPVLIYWSTSDSPYARITNFIYFLFLIIWFFNLIVVIFYLREKIKINFTNYVKYFYITGSIVVVLFLFKENNNILVAHTELIDGTAIEYDSKMNDMYRQIYESKSDTCVLDGIEKIPKTFIEVQFASDPYEIYNYWYTRYFHKKRIYFQKYSKTTFE